MSTLFDVLLRMARELDESFESNATGGSATTLVDAANSEPDGYWNNGTLFLVAGPRVGTTLVITDWDNPTKTFTIPTGTAITTANRYLALHGRWARGILIRAVNGALAEQEILVDNETLTAEASKKVYTLPAGVSNLIRVMAGNDTDGWEDNFTWLEAQGEVIFYAHAPAAGKTIRLRYACPHADLVNDSDALNIYINLDVLHLDAMTKLHQHRFDVTDDKEEKRLADEFGQKARLAHFRHPKYTPVPKLTGF
jgi:hypothetical protein